MGTDTSQRYELLERIATGGMAEVFRARSVGEHGFEKTLAIKRILPSLACDEEFVARFIDEAKLAVALTHANIVQIFDFGRFAGSLYIAMEFVEGGDLAKLLRAVNAAGRSVPVSTGLHIAIELCKGLDHAHRGTAHPVIHRDISPSNILLSYAGEVKVADFGIAQAIEHARGNTDVRIMGKWRYMSPEQARGVPLDERSDIFSAAAVMFEVFTGQRLVPAGEVSDIVRTLQETAWPRPSTLRPELPHELDDVLGKALARAPEERWSSIGEMMEALTEISYARSVRTSPRELGSLLHEFLPPAVGASVVETKPNLLDEIIKSEIGLEDPSEARRTVSASGLMVAAVDASGPLRNTTPELPRFHTPVMPSAFVKGVTDSRGLTTWTLADAKLQRPSRRQLWMRAGIALGSVLFLVVVAVVTSGRGERRQEPLTPTPVAALTINSEPAGADIQVDGRITGRRTPVDSANPLRLQPGRHRIRLTLSGHQPFEFAQEFSAGAPVHVPVNLARVPRILGVGSEPPDALVQVDGAPRGRTPVELTDVSAGKHALVVTLPGYEPWSETVALPETGTTYRWAALRAAPKQGKIDLTTAGAWANVFVDGSKKILCTTPCAAQPIAAGSRRLRFENPGAQLVAERSVVVPAGGKVSVFGVEMRPARAK